eukprot:PRCOL_00004180-RA
MVSTALQVARQAGGMGCSSLLRARITAFLAGFGVAGGGAMYQLRKDVWSSHEMIDARVKANGKDVDDKVQAMQKEIEQVKAMATAMAAKASEAASEPEAAPASEVAPEQSQQTIAALEE